MIQKTTQDILSDPVICFFRDNLTVALGVSLKELWLFGSRARGDNLETSDYDMLVVAEGYLPELRKIVSETNYNILDTYSELIGSIVFTPELWIQGKRTPLGMNILKQGIRVA